MNWAGKKVLVTGACGFIGSHLAERLVDVGADVNAFVYYDALGLDGWLGSSPKRKNMKIFVGDIRDRDTLLPALEGVSIVFHLAALIAIPYSYRSPVSYIRTNVEGTVNLLQAARMFPIERFVHTSTSEVYGTAQYVPIDEKHPLQGQSPYSASKIGADKQVEAFYHAFDFPVVTLRPFNTFGPRQSARAVIPTIITQCLSGDEIKLGNVQPTRDFSYVSDIVDAYLLAGMAPGTIGKTINVGSGREIRIADLCTVIAGLIGKTVRIQQDGERVRPVGSEVDRLIADQTQAEMLLGWKSKISLEDGLRKTIDWIRQNMDKFVPGTYRI